MSKNSALTSNFVIDPANVQPISGVEMQDQIDGQTGRDTQSTPVIDHPTPARRVRAKKNDPASSDQIDGQTARDTQSRSAIDHPTPARKTRAKKNDPVSDQIDDPMKNATQARPVIDHPTPARRVRAKKNDPVSDQIDDQEKYDTQPESVIDHPTDDDLGRLIEQWRQRQDIRRAENRLNLQCQAICRRASGGDKETAAKLWGQIKKDQCTDIGLLLILEPYRTAMAHLDADAKAIEKDLAKQVRKVPLWCDFGKDVKGLGELSMAGFLGEAGRPVTDYRSVSALWKRFGLAVIGDQRQRRVADAALALEHGYSPQRRSYAYVLATNLLRAQGSDGPYRKIYDARKEIEAAKDGITKAHAHNRAMRYMVKELLKHIWVAARKTSPSAF